MFIEFKSHISHSDPILINTDNLVLVRKETDDITVLGLTTGYTYTVCETYDSVIQKLIDNNYEVKLNV